MMVYLRARFGLDCDDTSKDEAILEMTPVEIVRECTEWRLGNPSCANAVASWMECAGTEPEDF